ncbi:MAG: 50S ribosomal protein L18a [Candidatus Diapherotrites archaeon]|nr:50S ribosomal protein L18a [Candidatus Diapherotrites archaeon]
MQFEVTGKYKEKRDWKPFRKIIDAKNEKLAEEYTLSLIGSKHKVKRRHIIIQKIERYEEKEEVKENA